GERGEVRAIFLMDAPRDYFAVPALPEVAVDVLKGEVFPMEPGVRRDALLFARELGLGPESTLRGALETLTDHFRAFREASGTLAERASIYLDLARSMRGVCRHRVYAFVITAQALGIPARFAQNEAHAWAEVKLAGVGWMRIDLGGAANGLDARNAADRPVYRSRVPDPLPQPAAYRESYSQLRGAVTGLRPGEAAGETPGGASTGGASTGGASTATASMAPAGAPATAPAGSSDAEDGGGDPLDAIFGPSAPRTPEVTPRPVRLSVAPREAEVYRGQTLTFQGRALDPDDGGVSGLRIEVLLRGPTERLLGVTVTRADGAYRATVGVPPELPVGAYRLVVRTPGDAAHLPATAP
ncbi:MAG: transglutaminase domain-containing protein, partial [Myxococcota bacterium]